MPDDSALNRIKKRQLSRPQVPERGSPYEVNNSLEPETIEVANATTPTNKDTRKGGSLRLMQPSPRRFGISASMVK
jgi:hypothetical protein